MTTLTDKEIKSIEKIKKVPDSFKIGSVSKEDLLNFTLIKLRLRTREILEEINQYLNKELDPELTELFKESAKIASELKRISNRVDRYIDSKLVGSKNISNDYYYNRTDKLYKLFNTNKDDFLERISYATLNLTTTAKELFNDYNILVNGEIVLYNKIDNILRKNDPEFEKLRIKYNNSVILTREMVSDLRISTNTGKEIYDFYKSVNFDLEEFDLDVYKRRLKKKMLEDKIKADATSQLKESIKDSINLLK